MTKRKRDEDGFSIRVKVWIEDANGDLVMGMGRVAMFEAIERAGSLNQAARELNMSYRALWGRLRKTEDRLGKKLLVRATGGQHGGGSELTPLGKSMMKRFRQLNTKLEKQAQTLFNSFNKEFLESDKD